MADCLKEGDFDPFPITVNTLLHLEEIIGIDHNENSINVGVKLWVPSPPELNANQMLNLDEPKPDLDERIKRLDFATMLFSLIYFITFVFLYLTVL